jgi:deazaflavin-dependent oxidoreductase (nitroreductase family)
MVHVMMRWLRRWVGRIEVAEVRRFGRSGIGLFARTPVLELRTVGRRTGRARSTPVAYHEDRDGTLFVVGGAGGQQRIPDWVANLRAHPDAQVLVRREVRPVTAVELSGDERAAVWPALVAVWPRIATYERRAGRPVPVFRLVPRERVGKG